MTYDDRCPGGDDEITLTPPPTVESSADDLTEVFDLLSCTRRRYAVYYLYETEGSAVAVADLADYVDGIEPDDDPGSDDAERIEIDLHHVQLPKMDEYGVIDYDRRTRTVRYVGWSSFDDWMEWVYRAEIDRS